MRGLSLTWGAFYTGLVNQVRNNTTEEAMPIILAALSAWVVTNLW